MNIIYEYNLWILLMNINYGCYLWISFMNTIYEYNLRIEFMNIIYEYNLWIWLIKMTWEGRERKLVPPLDLWPDSKIESELLVKYRAENFWQNCRAIVLRDKDNPCGYPPGRVPIAYGVLKLMPIGNWRRNAL